MKWRSTISCCVFLFLPALAGALTVEVVPKSNDPGFATMNVPLAGKTVPPKYLVDDTGHLVGGLAVKDLAFHYESEGWIGPEVRRKGSRVTIPVPISVPDGKIVARNLQTGEAFTLLIGNVRVSKVFGDMHSWRPMAWGSYSAPFIRIDGGRLIITLWSGAFQQASIDTMQQVCIAVEDSSLNCTPVEGHIIRTKYPSNRKKWIKTWPNGVATISVPYPGTQTGERFRLGFADNSGATVWITPGQTAMRLAMGVNLALPTSTSSASFIGDGSVAPVSGHDSGQIGLSQVVGGIRVSFPAPLSANGILGKGNEAFECKPEDVTGVIFVTHDVAGAMIGYAIADPNWFQKWSLKGFVAWERDGNQNIRVVPDDKPMIS